MLLNIMPHIIRETNSLLSSHSLEHSVESLPFLGEIWRGIAVIKRSLHLKDLLKNMVKCNIHGWHLNWGNLSEQNN